MLIQNYPSNLSRQPDPVPASTNGTVTQVNNPLPKSPLHRKRGRGLRTKVTAWAIALSTIPIALIGSGAYWLSERSFNQRIRESYTSQAVQLMDKINYFLYERYTDIQVLANLPVLADPGVRATVTTAEKQQILNQYVAAYGTYDSIAVFDLDGKLIVQSSGPSVGENHRDRRYFQAVLKANRAIIDPPERSENSSALNLRFAAPVKDSVSGKTVAIIQARLPLDQVQAIASPYGNESTHYHILDERGMVFISDEADELGVSLDQEMKGLLPLRQRKQAGAVLATDINQTEQLVGYAPMQPLQGLPNLNWGSIVEVETEFAFQTWRNLGWALTVGTLASAAIVAAIAAYLADRLTRPLREAAEAVEQIGEGNLNSRLNIRGQDEIAVLGTNINRMAYQIQSFVQRQKSETELANQFAAIALKLRQSNNPAEILTAVVEEVRLALQCDRVVIYRFKPNWSGYIAAESVLDGLPKALAEEIADDCIHPELIEAYKAGRVVPTADVKQAGFHPNHLLMLNRLQVQANLITPVLLHTDQETELYGLLIAHYCGEPHEWQQSEVDLLFKLAIQTGYALEQAMTVTRIEQARLEARREADTKTEEQRQQKEFLQQRAMELLREVDPVSRGDLTVRAKVTSDEIGTIADSYNAITSALRQIVEQVQTAAKSVSYLAGDNEVAIATLSEEAKLQMQSITRVLGQVQAMSQSIQGVATRAKQAETGVQKATQRISEGDVAMNRTVSGMSSIRSTVAETAKKVKRLGEASQKISRVVNLIGDFAAQTNLLALNAAIEAARAGEEGRGFAVVAEEVRSLAQQSANATAEIEELVEEIQAQTNEVVMAMEAGTEQVVYGTQLVEETRQRLTQIAAVGSQINRLVVEISQAADLQTQASHNVTHTMQQVAAIAQKTSRQSDSVSRSFTDLLNVAEALKDKASQFKVK
jgi:methyl-accepting chemotaxis protein PixJ